MSGRQEVDNKYRARIANILAEAPNIIIEYADSFIAETIRTEYKYIIIVYDFVKFLKEDLKMNIDDMGIYKNIRVAHIKRYIGKGNDSDNKKTTTANKLSAISHFFGFLCENQYVSQNLCKEIKRPKDKRILPIVAMTPEEISQLKKNIETGYGSPESIMRQKKWKNRDLAIITLGCSTGLRVSSICEINMSDIDLKKGTIEVIEKGEYNRTCYIKSHTISVIKDWIKDREELLDGKPCDALFISNRRQRISSEAVGVLLRKYTAGFDKHITPHKMRSSCATNLYEKTGDIYVVKNVLGHRNIENTKRYAKSSDDRMKEALEILDSIY